MAGGRGWNSKQRRGLPILRLNSDPEGQIFLSYMDRLMMNCFPLFSKPFSWNIKRKIKIKILTLYSFDKHLFWAQECFIGYENGANKFSSIWIFSKLFVLFIFFSFSPDLVS